MRWGIVASYETNLEGIEPNVIYSIQQLLTNRNLYNNPEVAPFSITQYSPIYYYLCSYTSQILHLDPTDNIYEIYVVGRAWSLIFNILTAIIIFFAIYNALNIDWKIAIVGSVYSFIFLYTWNFAVRPDSMISFIILLAVFFFLKHLTIYGRHMNLYLMIVLSLSVISIFIKQSGVQLPIIFVSFLLLMKQWRAFIVSCLIVTILLF